MAKRGYEQALVAAEMLAPTGYAAGVPVWRERGLLAANLLIDRFVQRLRSFCEPTLIEHPALLPAPPYREVFGHYRNTYGAYVTEAGGDVVLRPDNMTASISLLRSRLQSGPVIATGGLLRVLLGSGTPLFRDRYMWPAVQVSHVVPRNRAANTLDAHQRAIEDVIRALGLPVVSVRTSQLPEYGKLCYLTVSVLPDGRPTILSTSYIMAERYRTALRVDDEVLDIGFTGKLIALAAMHHCDARGIMLPSVIAGTQVGALLDDSPAAREWLDTQLRAGLRVEHAHPGPQPYRRIRAERRMHRRGTPLVVGLFRDRPHVGIVRRGPLERVRQLTAPPPEAIRTELAAYDRQLLVRSFKKFHNGLLQTGAIRGLCHACARTEPIFGWVAPRRATACAHCGRSGADALVSPQGRFY